MVLGLHWTLMLLDFCETLYSQNHVLLQWALGALGLLWIETPYVRRYFVLM